MRHTLIKLGNEGAGQRYCYEVHAQLQARVQ